MRGLNGAARGAPMRGSARALGGLSLDADDNRQFVTVTFWLLNTPMESAPPPKPVLSTPLVNLMFGRILTSHVVGSTFLHDAAIFGSGCSL